MANRLLQLNSTWGTYFYYDSDNSLPVYNNSDSNKYFEGYAGGVLRKFYNSAIYRTPYYEACLFLFEEANIVTRGSQEGPTFTLNFNGSSGNGLYTRNSFINLEDTEGAYYNDSCIESRDSTWDLITDIPVFYDIDEFVAYTTNPAQPPYHWSSVPAISGKNGILSLPTLIDTDGEPISGQSASVFSSLPEGSNVRALINGAL